jgi:hypothetical protein
MAKEKLDYKQRQDVRRERGISDSTTLGDLLKICNNNTNATIEIDWYYDDCNVMLTWHEPETDLEMTERIARYESVLAYEKAKKEEKDKKTLAAEKREYLRLKKKFEKSN